MIREETGDWDSSPSAISKQLVQIKAQLDRTAAIDATKITKADMTSLRNLVFGILERSSARASLLGWRAHPQKLVANAECASVRIDARQPPFEMKYAFKARGYAWDAPIKSW